ASSLEVAKQRSPLRTGFGQAVEIRIKGIGEIARASGRIESVGRAVEQRPVLEHESLPRLLLSSGAPACELEVAGVGHGHLARTGSTSSSWSWNGRPSVSSAACSMRGTRSIGSSDLISSPPLAACRSLNLRAFTRTLPSREPTESL